MFSSKEKVSVHCTVLYNIYAEVSSSVIWEEKKEKKSLRHLKYGFVKKLLHNECTSCQLTISSHQNMEGYLLHPPNFDDWKWSTDKRCIRNEVTS